MPNPSPSERLQRFIRGVRSGVRRSHDKYTRILRNRRTALNPDAVSRAPTAGLPVGSVFLNSGTLYEVIEHGGGFDFARAWKGHLDQKFALNPLSAVARFYPVIEFGEPLPDYTRKRELLDASGRVLCFVFESVRQADNVADLEAALARRSGCRLRSISASLCGLHDGAFYFRLYSIRPPDSALLQRLELSGDGQVSILSSKEGPYYWEWISDRLQTTG